MFELLCVVCMRNTCNTLVTQIYVYIYIAFSCGPGPYQQCLTLLFGPSLFLSGSPFVPENVIVFAILPDLLPTVGN